MRLGVHSSSSSSLCLCGNGSESRLAATVNYSSTGREALKLQPQRDLGPESYNTQNAL